MTTPSFLFFLSGFSSLLYQIVWVRLALGHFGVITPVLSVVLSVFMLGLGVGSWLGGAVSRSPVFRRQSPIFWYALAELFIAAWALGVPLAFQAGDRWFIQNGAMNSFRYGWQSMVIITLAILPPCISMGTTFPLMMAYIRTIGPVQKLSFSRLYRANVLGAFCGSALTALFLIEVLGFRKVQTLGVLGNVLAGIIGLFLFRRVPASDATSHIEGQEEPGRSPPDPTLSPRMALAILGVTGFTSLAYEVLWTRAFTPVLGTTIYAFGMILAVDLVCLWVGTSWYRMEKQRSVFRSTRLLLGVLGISASLPFILTDPRFHLGAAGCLLGLVPFCVLLGYLTPGMVDAYALGNPEEAGMAYAVNIAGCVIGPLIASYLVLPNWGTKKGALFVAVPLFMLWGVCDRVGSLAAFILWSSLSFHLRSAEEDMPGIHGPSQVRRDYVATVVSAGQGFDKRLFVNGVGITVLTPLSKAMAHLPILSHIGPPKTALVICFGMGTSYRSLLSYGLQTTAVELVPSVLDAFPYYFDDAPAVLQDPRGTIVIDDGRRFLHRTSQCFDIITLDPPPPVEAAGSGLLYSTEFYDAVKARLAPNGILQQWWPQGELKILLAVTRSLTQSFPFVRVYKGVGGIGFHFLASLHPIPRPTRVECLARMPPKARRDLLEWNPGWKVDSLIAPFFEHEIRPEAILAGSSVPALTDDQPYNEYFLIRRWRDRRAKRAYQVR